LSVTAGIPAAATARGVTELLPAAAADDDDAADDAAN